MSHTSPEEISAAVDAALEAALDAKLDPAPPAMSVREVLQGFGVPETLARSLLLSACHAYENVMRGQRRVWEARSAGTRPDR